MKSRRNLNPGFLGLSPSPLVTPGRDSRSYQTKIAIGTLLFSLVVLVSVAAFALSRSATSDKWARVAELERQLAALLAARNAAAEAPPAPPAGPVDAEAVPGTEPASVAEDSKPIATTPPKPEKKRPVRREPRRELVDAAERKVERAAVKPPPVRDPEAPKGDSALERLLNPETVERGRGKLPKTLSRRQVQAGMDKVARAIRSCGGGRGGSVTVLVTISNDGKISNAQVTGSLAGSPLGACVTRYVRRATFPKFSDPPIRVKYPFSF